MNVLGKRVVPYCSKQTLFQCLSLCLHLFHVILLHNAMRSLQLTFPYLSRCISPPQTKFHFSANLLSNPGLLFNLIGSTWVINRYVILYISFITEPNANILYNHFWNMALFCELMLSSCMNVSDAKWAKSSNQLYGLGPHVTKISLGLLNLIASFPSSLEQANTLIIINVVIALFSVHVHPCEKVIGMFFQNQIWSRLLDINRLRLVCIKRSIEEVKKCQISKHGYHQWLSDETLKKAWCQFCDVKFGHRIMEAMGFFDYKMHSITQITLNFTNRWSKGVFWWLSDIILHKWYFRKL